MPDQTEEQRTGVRDILQDHQQTDQGRSIAAGMESGQDSGVHLAGMKSRSYGHPSHATGHGDSLQFSAGMVPVCSGCGEKIKDAFILRVSPDMVWHAACLQCSDCHCNLADNPTCFLRDGKMYCKTDYVRLFSMKCAHCQETLQSSDLVLRAQGEVYHQDCFRCSDCHCQLLPGDLFTFQPQGLHCITHRQLEQERERNEISDAREDNQNTQQYPGICPNFSPKSEVVLKQPAEKLSRMRTVLNEQQLQALRTCYSMNPRPDAILKEKLVEVTGLSPRVIRVWFQNKRCKDKKRALMMQQSQKHPSEIQVRTEQHIGEMITMRGQCLGTILMDLGTKGKEARCAKV